MSAHATQSQVIQRPALVVFGRAFVHPVFDALLIGGGLSLIVSAIVLADPSRGQIVDRAALPYFLLLSNSAHFASSTVRLYTKPGTRQSLPFLTTAFPLVVFAVLIASLFLAGSVGPHLTAFYLTWSPYHYAAQAYGLAVMYAYRSGCQLLPGDKSLLWWTSLLPFCYAFVGDRDSGLHWLLPESMFANFYIHTTLMFVLTILSCVCFLAVAVLVVKTSRSASGTLPVISIMMLVSNAVWWCLLPQQAFVWATVFHGLQYLAIVTIFHVKDQLARPDNRRNSFYHIALFYGSSLALGYALFSCLPWGLVCLGFGMMESIFLVVVAVNLHHFIVDAYIWRLKKGDANRGIVESGLTPAV